MMGARVPEDLHHSTESLPPPQSPPQPVRPPDPEANPFASLSIIFLVLFVGCTLLYRNAFISFDGEVVSAS